MKIYLAKSNRANPNIVSEVREILKQMPNVEIVEYVGGKYSNQPLIESDYLIIVPETVSDINEAIPTSINIGKGLNSQIVEFPLKPNIFIVSHVQKYTGLVLSSIVEMKHTEIDMATNWAICVLDPNISIDNFALTMLLNSKQHGTTSISKKEEPKKDLPGSELTHDIPTLS